MKTASHNTMTYLPVSKWWMRFLQPVAKCQSKSVIKQIEKHGVSYLDLRVTFKNGYWQFAHGAVIYKGDAFTFLKILNALTGVKLTIRMILEDYRQCSIFEEHIFKVFCWEIQKKYKNLIFVGGRRKSDWKQLYNFGTIEPTIDNQYSSMAAKRFKGWFPFGYALFNNARSRKNGTEKDFLMLDFVNINKSKKRHKMTPPLLF